MKKESHKCALECDSKGSWKGKIPVPMVDHIFSFLKYLEEQSNFAKEKLPLCVCVCVGVQMPMSAYMYDGIISMIK